MSKIWSIIYLANGDRVQMLEPWKQTEHTSGRITLSDHAGEYLGTIYPNGMVQMAASCKHQYLSANQMEKSKAFSIVEENLQGYTPEAIKQLKAALTKFDSHKKTWKK